MIEWNRRWHRPLVRGVLSIVTILGFAGCGGDLLPQGGGPEIVEFKASPSEVPAGNPVLLSWQVAAGGDVELRLEAVEQGGGAPRDLGDVTGLENLAVEVNADTTFRLHASSRSGTSSRETSVRVAGDAGSGEKILILIAGQSNASGSGLEQGDEFPVSGETESPQEGVWMLRDNKWAIASEPTHSGNKHSFGVRLGKEIRAATGLDVYLVPAAVAGSSLDRWKPSGGDLFATALDRAQFASNDLGVPVNAVVWFQGESETSEAGERRNFLSRTDGVLSAFHDRLPGQPDIIFVQLSKRLFHGTVAGDNEEGHNLAYQDIREKQRLMEAGAIQLAIGQSPPASPHSRPYYHMAVSHDLPMSDMKHVSAAGQRELDRRLASVFLTRVWNGPVKTGEFGPGPRLERVFLDGSTVVVDTTLTVNDHHNYAGYFTVFVGGEKVNPSSIGRDDKDDTRIRITLPAKPNGEVYVRYMPPDGTKRYQGTPNAVHSVVGGLRMPLPAFGLPVELDEGQTFPGVRLGD